MSEIGAWIWSILTNKWFIINNVLSYLLLEYAFRKLGPLYKKSEEQKIRDKRFPSFVRRDNISRPFFYLFGSGLFIRMICGYGALALCSVCIFFLSFTHKKGTPYTGWKFSLITLWCSMAARVNLFCVGIWWIYTEEIDYDYKKYLGPDWKADKNKKPGTIITNHQSWLDIMAHMYRQPPSHVSKDSVRRVPFIGHIADSVGCLFLQREDSSQKNTMVSQIAKRQEECEQGIYSPLIIYPEGGTTNGRSLIQFKKGAFKGLRSIKPVIFNYISPFMDPENCVIHFAAQSLIMATIPYVSLTIKELPTFEPNDFFFKNHQKEGEDKWETYARIMREIMAKEGNYQLSDNTIEDKFEYKKQLYGKGRQSD